MNNPKNPKLYRCGACKKDLRGKWFMQIKHNIFCVEHYKQVLKKLKK